MARQALGKGLDALIPVDQDFDSSTPLPKHELPIEAIAPNPFQPRRDFAPRELEELTASIREKGLVQPVIVRPRAGGGFELVAGERRLRAAKLAGLAQIPAVVREVSDQDSLEMALVENIQRTDLNPVEEARAYHQLSAQFNLTQEDMAKKVGKDRSSVANTLRLLKLPERVLEWVETGRLSEGHARAILALESEKAMVSLAEKIMRDKLNVREAERLSQGMSSKVKKGKGPKAEIKDPHVRDLEDTLKRKLGTKVRVLPRGGQKGKIEIEYYSLEDLGRIVELLS